MPHSRAALWRVTKRIIPSLDLELHSALSAQAASEALASHVEAKKWLRWGGSSCPFEGVVDGGSFDIQRVIHYRNSALPQIRGQIDEQPTGCSISIRIRVADETLALLAIWSLAVVVESAALRLLLSRESET
jgi:hypothetical protein